jgi:hypothetical protein
MRSRPAVRGVETLLDLFEKEMRVAMTLSGCPGQPSRYHADQAVDPSAPLMIGNGQIGFTADITGLQTFPEAYSKHRAAADRGPMGVARLSQSEGHYTYADGTTPIDVRGTKQPYAYMKDWNEAETRPALNYLRENPHRFSLGRVALDLRDKAGKPAKFEDLAKTEQTLDLWSGVLTSRFVYDGEAVTVRTRMHPTLDMIVVDVDSALVAARPLEAVGEVPGRLQKPESGPVRLGAIRNYIRPR